MIYLNGRQQSIKKEDDTVSGVYSMMKQFSLEMENKWYTIVELDKFIKDCADRLFYGITNTDELNNNQIKMIRNLIGTMNKIDFANMQVNDIHYNYLMLLAKLEIIFYELKDLK